MKDKLREAWSRAEKTGEAVDIGDIVVCDLCSEDYTNSEETGGFLFSSKAVCPKCAPRFMADVKRYNEMEFIRDRCGPEETFKNFVMRIRGGDNTIKVTKIR